MQRNCEQAPKFNLFGLCVDFQQVILCIYYDMAPATKWAGRVHAQEAADGEAASGKIDAFRNGGYFNILILPL